MDVGEAFKRLGLPSDASTEDVLGRHKVLAKLAHSDQAHVDDSLMASINAARDTALAHRTGGHLVPRTATGALDAASERGLLRYQEARTASEVAVRSLVRVRVSRLRDQRNRAAGAAAASGFTTVVLQAIQQFEPFIRMDSLAARRLSPGTFVVGVVFACVALRAAQQARRNERAIEDIQDTLDDKPRYIELLRELGMLRRGTDWTPHQVLSRVQEWLSQQWPPGADAPARGNPVSRLRRRLRRTMVYRCRAREVRWWRETIAPDGTEPSIILRAVWWVNAAAGEYRSVADAAEVIGHDEFSRLLLRKGVEHRLLEGREGWSDNELSLTYELRLPSGSGST